MKKKLSILDLVILSEGQIFTQAYQNTIIFAQVAEEVGYNRFWLAEHYNSKGIVKQMTDLTLVAQRLFDNKLRIYFKKLR